MGFLPRARTRELVCDFPGLEPAEGSDPLTATVVSSLTFDDLDAIPNPLYVENGRTMYRSTQELRAAIAPHVLAWNCEAVNRETGKTEPVPAPADGGPDAFRAVDTLVVVWLALALKGLWVGADEKKGAPPATAPSEDTPPPSPEPSSSSEAPRGTSRKNRKDSRVR